MVIVIGLNNHTKCTSVHNETDILSIDFHYISQRLSFIAILKPTIFACHPKLAEYGHQKQGSPYSWMHHINYPRD